MLDDKKVAFITCVNSDWWYDECRLYLEHLKIPEGMTAEIIPVREAESMTAGYNRAMKNSSAKYKIYLHQDTFIVNKNLVADLLKIFLDSSIGVVGVIGCMNLPADSARPPDNLRGSFLCKARRRTCASRQINPRANLNRTALPKIIRLPTQPLDTNPPARRNANQRRSPARKRAGRARKSSCRPTKRPLQEDSYSR